ncbi:MAG: cellulase family glycosylhydrolase, partial [Candidatus Saccharimonadales bacterium]
NGEIALVQELGYEQAKARLEKHRDSFITEKDFKWIANQGFHFVRLPVGHWLFAETDDFIDGEVYLSKAFQWATTHKLKILLDFHGLQGSQNGYDHSGQVGKVRLYRHGNRGRALETLEYMCRTYGKHPQLLAIEIINEPKVRWFLWRLLRYYDHAIEVARRHVGQQVKIIVSDAFKPRRMAKAIKRRGYGDQVVLDVHLYQVFSKQEQAMLLEEHIVKVNNEWKVLLEDLREDVPVLIGEWSAALPAYAYESDGTNEADNVESYFNAQQELFESVAWAHSYWSYKTPGAGVWDYHSQSRFHQ